MSSRSLLLFAAVAFGCGCGTDPPRRLRPPPGAPSHAIEIHVPERLTGVLTKDVDALGRPVRVACVTCHSIRTPTALPTSMDALREFHQGLAFAHGQLGCAMCHVPGDQSQLHLADGSLIGMRDALRLCAQCHGPQLRDYTRGSHGGMNGYWDLSAGPRTRNHCIDCHDPHVPLFQPSRPVLPPRDRGLVNHPPAHEGGSR